MDEFSGKVVLVTGADVGMGREVALAFGARGAMVAANALTPVNLDETVSRVQAAGGEAEGYVADIASKLALQTMINEIIDQYGRLDILVQTASVEPKDALLDMDEWDWRRTLDVNLTGVFVMTQAVGRVMRSQRRGGAIVNVCSVLLEASQMNSRAAFYASQGGLQAFTLAAASEMAQYDIRVNAVCHGELNLETPAKSNPSIVRGLESAEPFPEKGLSNLDEYKYNTHPMEEDTDGDGGIDLFTGLAKHYSPVIYQHVDVSGDHSLGGKSDLIMNYDFDGQWVGEEKWDNLENHAGPATLYGPAF